MRERANPVSAGCPLPPSWRSMTERSLPWRRRSWDLKAFSDLSRPLNLCCTSNTKLQDTDKQNENKNKPSKASRLRSMIRATFRDDLKQNQVSITAMDNQMAAQKKRKENEIEKESKFRGRTRKNRSSFQLVLPTSLDPSLCRFWREKLLV